MPYRIRESTLDDAPAFVEHLQRHALESGRDGDLIFHSIQNPDSKDMADELAKTIKNWQTVPPALGWEKCWLIEPSLGGEVFGHIALRSKNHAASLHRCLLAIGLERSVRRRGLGRESLAIAIDWALHETQLDWIDLYAFSHNTPALHLYAEFGFKVVGETIDLFRLKSEDGYRKVNDIHMTLALGKRIL